MRRRIDAAPVIAGLGGLLLFLSLLLDWYEPELSPWTVFELIDLLLALLAIGALAYAAEALGAPLRLPRGVLPLLGIVAFVLVASQLVDPPPAVAEESDPETGAWLALAGAAILLIGALLSRAGVSLAVDVDRMPGAAGAPGARAESTEPGPAPETRPPAEPAAPPPTAAPGDPRGPGPDEPTARLDDETRRP